jgi:para-aminobenzoate synthetase component 1
MKKKGTTLISQPIKGTSKRNHLDPIQDSKAIQYLKESGKEKSENVMIVDLVRNDLSKVSSRGSVAVEELMGIYSFPQVHQMISTVVSELDERFHWTEAIQACYPMGSMTGAPKKRVMELINQYEKTPRGLFSGTIGYIDPERNFDFNVVIRSYFYDSASKQLCFKAGGGITIKSDAEQEYKESLLKVEILKKLIGERR